MKNSERDTHPTTVHIELRRLIDHNHPLAQLRESINWTSLELALRPPKSSNFSTRQMLALHYLRHTYELSDKDVISKTSRSPYYQYFCGFKHFSPEIGISEEDMQDWRAKLGSHWSTELLVAAMESELRPDLLELQYLGRRKEQTATG